MAVSRQPKYDMNRDINQITLSDLKIFRIKTGCMPTNTTVLDKWKHWCWLHRILLYCSQINRAAYQFCIRPRSTDSFSIPKADTQPKVRNLIPFYPLLTLSCTAPPLWYSFSLIHIIFHYHHHHQSSSFSPTIFKVFKAVYSRYWHFLFFETICPSGCGIFHWPTINFKWHLLCHSYLNVNNGTVFTSSTCLSFAHNLSYLEEFKAFESSIPSVLILRFHCSTKPSF